MSARRPNPDTGGPGCTTAGTSADAAFDLLSKESQLTKRKLRDIAQDLVDDVRPSGQD